MPGVQRGGRIRGKYTRNERAIIDPFKAEYMKAETPRERQHVAMNLIFKQLFVYWTQNDGVIGVEDANLRGENLAYWLQNNWRGPKTKTKFATPLVVKKSDVLYHLKKEEVFEEIAAILGVEQADTKTERWFSTRTIAIRNVMDRMTPAETLALDKEVKRIENEGYSAEQKHINAVKHCTRRFQNAAKLNWMEMGVLSVSIVAYLNTSNQLVVEIHDNSAGVAGVKVAKNFQERHRDKLREVQRLWLDYVREILDRQAGIYPRVSNPNPGIGNNFKANDETDENDELTIGFSEDGFPRIPAGLKIDKLNKKDGTALLRSYLAQNYLLASRNQSSHVPYTAIAESPESQREYIKTEYLPAKFQLIDPQNMKISAIRDFFHHIKMREAREAPSQVFRFSKVHSARSKGIVIDTAYPDEENNSRPPIVKKQTKRKKEAVEEPNAAQTEPMPGSQMSTGGVCVQSSVNGHTAATEPMQHLHIGTGVSFSEFPSINTDAAQTQPPLQANIGSSGAFGQFHHAGGHSQPVQAVAAFSHFPLINPDAARTQLAMPGPNISNVREFAQFPVINADADLTQPALQFPNIGNHRAFSQFTVMNRNANQMDPMQGSHVGNGGSFTEFSMIKPHGMQPEPILGLHSTDGHFTMINPNTIRHESIHRSHIGNGAALQLPQSSGIDSKHIADNLYGFSGTGISPWFGPNTGNTAQHLPANINDMALAHMLAFDASRLDNSHLAPMQDLQHYPNFYQSSDVQPFDIHVPRWDINPSTPRIPTTAGDPTAGHILRQDLLMQEQSQQHIRPTAVPDQANPSNTKDQAFLPAVAPLNLSQSGGNTEKAAQENCPRPKPVRKSKRAQQVPGDEGQGEMATANQPDGKETRSRQALRSDEPAIAAPRFTRSRQALRSDEPAINEATVISGKRRRIPKT